MIRKIISGKVFRWAMMGLYAGLIFMGSSISIEITDELDFFYPDLLNLPYMDKCVHFIEFGILCTLLCWALSAHIEPRFIGNNRIRKLTFMAVIFTSLYGITDEFHQLFVPTRMGTVYDWLADTAGATIAGLVWLKIFPAWKARSRGEEAKRLRG